MKLLIIDDNQQLALSLAAYFEDEGIDSQIADSAELAKKVFAENTFDGAVVDFYLPGADGATWIEWALGRSPGLACVIYTGSLTLSIQGRLNQFSVNPIKVFQKTHIGAAELAQSFLAPDKTKSYPTGILD